MSNEAIKKLCQFPIGGEAGQVLFAIIRKTWGWNKTQDAIALSTLVEMTALHQRSIRRALNKLMEMKVIKRVRESAHHNPATYCLNEHYGEWRRCANLRSDGCADMRNSKDTIKDNTKDKNIDSPPCKRDDIPYQEIIDDLNEQRRLVGLTRPITLTEGAKKAIRGRWKEGHRLEQFGRVHRVKCLEWGSEQKTRVWLTPATLYSPDNFAKYMAQEMPKGRYGYENRPPEGARKIDL